jgi:hypothetical protein
MTAEKYPTRFMVLGVKDSPIEDKETEKDNPLIFNSFERAVEVAIEYHKEDNFPVSIVMLSTLAEGITEESLNSPMLDYVPQRIERIKNCEQTFNDLIQLQNACAVISLAGEEGKKCGH